MIVLPASEDFLLALDDYRRATEGRIVRGEWVGAKGRALPPPFVVAALAVAVYAKLVCALIAHLDGSFVLPVPIKREGGRASSLLRLNWRRLGEATVGYAVEFLAREGGFKCLTPLGPAVGGEVVKDV